MQNILGLQDLENDKDLIFQKTLYKNFNQRDIDNILSLLYKEELAHIEIEIIELFFLRLEVATGSLFNSVVEFCKLNDINIDNVKGSLRKTSIFNNIRATKNRGYSKSFLNLFL